MATLRLTTSQYRQPLLTLVRCLQQPSMVSSKAYYSSEKIAREHFMNRHIGPNEEEKQAMLKAVGFKSFEDMTKHAVPEGVRLQRDLNISTSLPESQLLQKLRHIATQNKIWRSYIGMGYYNCEVPAVILRNIFENPGWYTSYTPYQPEISQGRLESLLNFQTMVCELVGMEMTNASMLDEGTAAAEAMNMAVRKTQKHTFLVDKRCHPQTIAVVRARAKA